MWDRMVGRVGQDGGTCGTGWRDVWDRMAGRVGQDGGTCGTGWRDVWDRMVGRVGHNGRVHGGAWDATTGRMCVQECTGDSAYTSGVWTHARGLARVDVLSSFVHNMMMDAWQEDQVRRMNVHVLLAPGHCHAHAASVAWRQCAAH